MSDSYDIIIIGTGAGGGTLLNRLARSGKRILVIERGPFLPREKENWTYKGSFKYYSGEAMHNVEGEEVRPGFSYHVGGNTKLFGAALFRLREKDFESYPHDEGISPEWPIKYRDWESYYTQAEELYQVHGKGGADPTEPWRTRDYPFPPISHEPRVAELFQTFTERGLHPYPAPMGIRLNENSPRNSPCIRCSTCDGYPCMVDAKSDADILGVRPALREANVTLLTEARVVRLETSASGLEVTGVITEARGSVMTFRADVVVVSCGAVNSAALLLRSANERHPDGIGNNSSGLVGRNLMKHVLGSLVAVTNAKVNPSRFQKTMALNDFYWGEPGYSFPLGNIQLMGKTVMEALIGQEAKYAPLTLEEVAQCSVDWWLTSEDVPLWKNRIALQGSRIVIDYDIRNNAEPFARLNDRWKQILQEIDQTLSPGSTTGYFTTKMPMHSLGHQVGTCKFGEDPATSVLDLNCRAHDLNNLYVVDGSFFVSSGAVNPTLTIVANALRVGDHLLERLKAKSAAASAPAVSMPHSSRAFALAN